MKVVMYSTTLHGGDGGAEVVFSQLASALEQQGADVVRVYRYPGPVAKETEWVLPLPSFHFRGYRTTLKSLPARLVTLWRLARGLAKLRPDIVNVHFTCSESIYLLLLRPFLRYRLVLTFHGSDALLIRSSDRRYVSYLIRHADAVTAVSECVGDAVRALATPAQPAVTVIPNGVPLAFWAASTSQRAAAGRRLVTVGRLARVKGHDVLIQAMALLHDTVPGATLTVIGDGAERPALEAEAERLGLAQVVTFAGRRSPEEVRAALRQADIFVMPSRSEGLGLALLEAMAGGLPAVASQVGGIPEVLTPETGLLVPPEDPSALAQALAELLLDPARAAEMGRAASVRAQAFSFEKVTAAYTHLLSGFSRGTSSSDGGTTAAVSAVRSTI